MISGGVTASSILITGTFLASAFYFCVFYLTGFSYKFSFIGFGSEMDTSFISVGVNSSTSAYLFVASKVHAGSFIAGGDALKPVSCFVTSSMFKLFSDSDL